MTREKLPFVDISRHIPDGVRGMTKLCRESFETSMQLPAIKCHAIQIGKVQQVFKDILFNRKNFRKIVSCPGEEQKKLVFLHTAITNLEQFNSDHSRFLKDNDYQFVNHQMKLTYNDFSFNEILKRICPEDAKDIVSSFETVGHIAHLNLKPSMLEYKSVIGEVLLDKNKHIKTVVNKTDTIEETFRFFKMELLAGEDNMNSTVVEHGCVFKFDYSKVYWNSRLQTEHKRIVDLIDSADTVFDVFAGVGPFSIPLAKKKCTVYANDLNEHSIGALKHNAVLNKVSDTITTYNMDGRQFLESVVIENICKSQHPQSKANLHIIMNLPAIAAEFLDVFKEKYAIFALPLDVRDNILVHCYCFAKSKTPEQEVVLRITEILGLDISSHSKTSYVRRVAPNKVMMCVTFKLFWFKHDVEKCSCCVDSILGRKRLIEGGFCPIVTTKKACK